MSAGGTELDEYGSAVADALTRRDEGGDGKSTHDAGRRALLEASARADKIALARFGASFLKAYVRPAPAASPEVEAVPVEPPAEPPAEPRLTMKEYAAFRAECIRAPASTLGDVRARHGLDAASDELEVAAWARVFAQDRSMFERYKALFQELRGTPTVPTAKVPVLVARAPGERLLSLSQYASLRAECISAPPEALAEVRARFGLDAASEVAEVQAWALAFKDAALFEEYKTLFHYYRSMLHPA